jgi:hypothetical protein
MALIATFDSGEIELEAEHFQNVIVISSGGFLYVSEALLNDPSCVPEGVRCLVGNIGRPAIALLLSPNDPIISAPDGQNWELINHDDFDGKWEDNFRSTSMHLKLTGYETPLNVGQHGGRYREVIYVEAIVSTHSRGEWIADVNLLSPYTFGQIFGRNWLSERLLPSECGHIEEYKNDSSDFGQLTSIDNWPELLDHPPNTSIIRAKGNWTARLALAAVMRMRKDNLIIVSDDMCWACTKELAKALDLDLRQLLILC